MNYSEVNFSIDPLIPFREILTVYLAEMPFDSFVETDNGLQAYIQTQDLDVEALQSTVDSVIAMEAKIDFSVREIEQQNWNATWESQFEPIEVSDICRVRAPFHEDKGLPFELIIEPKMSFGTGHHATTFLMLTEMLDMNWTGQKVLDMGSGTGVLAFLAEKSGAESIDAIDIDDWAYENAIENAARNHCPKTQVILGGAEKIESVYDVIIANINRNILVNDGPIYTEHLNAGGHLLLSGFYSEDQPILVEAFHGFELFNTRTKEGWCMLHLIKK
jgi:ribosomal protein L11 methyltransferase